MYIFDSGLLYLVLIFSFILSVFLTFCFIPVLHKFKFGQSIRDEGPKAHIHKAGTPTMGGTFIIIAFLIPILLMYAYLSYTSHKLHLSNILFMLFATVGYGLVGFIDDYIKIGFKRNLGLNVKQKFMAQIFIGLVLFSILVRVMDNYEVFSLRIPGFSDPFYMNWLLYLPIMMFLMVGCTNACNLTDGLDGLLTGSAICSYGAYVVIGFIKGNMDVVIFALAVIGALLGFLMFNAYPARIMMGDVGSLALGGGLFSLAVITETELLLGVIGGLYVVETLSVIIQVISFKLRGKRVFRMSPLHHHFELCGWSEWKVVRTFWSISFALAVIGVLIYKYGY